MIKKYIISFLFLVVLIPTISFLFKMKSITKIEKTYVLSKKTDKNKFLSKLAKKESSGKYNIISKSGSYFGAYQIGRIAFKELKFNIDEYGVANFLDNKQLQDSLIIELLKINRKYLKKHIKKYSGKIINNIKISESGIIAGGIMGLGYVIKFLESNGDTVPCDGNNIPVSSYIKEFSNLNISFLSVKNEKNQENLIVKK